MKTHVQFHSDKFPAYEGEEEEVNPGLWGKRLAEYLHDTLAAGGVAVGEIYSEDWGWAIPLENTPFSMWIGCGHQNGDDNEFLCFIEPSQPVIRKFFKKIDTTAEVGRVANALDKILGSAPKFARCAGGWMTRERWPLRLLRQVTAQSAKSTNAPEWRNGPGARV